MSQVCFLLLGESFYVRTHLGHTLLAIFRGGKSQLFDKCAVKGARRVKTDERADFRNAQGRVKQISASLGDAQRIDVIVKAQAESTAE